MQVGILRAIAGFIIGPAILPGVLYLFSFFSNPDWGIDFLAKTILFFGYIAAVVFGIPVYLVMRRKHFLAMWNFVFAGASVGFGMYAVLFIPTVAFGFQYGADHALTVLKNTAGYSVLGIGSGVVASMAFWLIAIRQHA